MLWAQMTAAEQARLTALGWTQAMWDGTDTSAVNNTFQNPAQGINNAVNNAVGGLVSQVPSWIAAAVGVVFSTIGSFLVNFLTGSISALRASTGSHLLALVVGLVVVVVMFR